MQELMTPCNAASGGHDAVVPNLALSNPLQAPIKPGAVPLSRHPYGCRVVQRVLEHCDIEGVRADMMKKILSSAYSLAQDTYGNYVIQHILEHGSAADR